MMDFSSFNDTYLHHHISSMNYTIPTFMYCFLSRPSAFVFTAYSVTKILLCLPLCISIFNIVLHQWSASSSKATVRHSDCFVYNMVIMELFSIIGSVLCCYSSYSFHLNILHVGCLIFSFSWYGQGISHILVSFEGYLATVHPITYMGWRKESRIRFRNAEIVCNWLLAFAGTSLVMFDGSFVVMDLVLLMISFTVIFFCSLSVLCVLIRPSPGNQGGVRKRFDLLKRRVLFSIVIVLQLLLIRFTWNLVWVVSLMSGMGDCLILMCCTFSSLPSSLVLPLLFIRREVKVVCCSLKI